jgi:HSP20 family protein
VPSTPAVAAQLSSIRFGASARCLRIVILDGRRYPPWRPAAARRKHAMAQADSFQELDSLHREIDRAFENFVPFARPFARMAFLPGRFARGYPLVNVHEDKDHIYVEAMAPGVDPKSLNITVVHNTLTVSGEKPGAPSEIKPEAFHREERARGKFVRTITLPVEIDDSKVGAEYKNGLLLITLPKSERAKPKQINVQVS